MPPPIFTLNLTWNINNYGLMMSDYVQAKIDHLKFLLTIPATFRLRELYEMSTPQGIDTYFFRGMICFYGNHYFAILNNEEAGGGGWTQYDDAHVREFPGGWAEIVEGMVDGEVQPVMLIYERADRMMP
jgi:hypothetical protein